MRRSSPFRHAVSGARPSLHADALRGHQSIDTSTLRPAFAAAELQRLLRPSGKNMSESSGFDERQKQYLSGFTFGADVARAVRGLPVLSGAAMGAASNGTRVLLDGGVAEVDSGPAIPERIALDAQTKAVASGAKLCQEEQAKRKKNPLDMWDEMLSRATIGAFPKGTDVFLTKFHGLFYVAPAQNSYMCRLRLPGGVLRGWQARGLAALAVRCAGGYVDVTTRANLQLREIPADKPMEVLYGLREIDIINLGSGGDNVRNVTASPLSGLDPDELTYTIGVAIRMHHYILNHREMFGLPRKFNIAFDGGGRISVLDDTNDVGFHAVRISEADETSEVPAGVYFQLALGGITGHQDFARDTGVLVTSSEAIEVAGAIVRVFVKSGDRTDRKRARLKYVLDAWGFERFLAAVEAELGRPLRRFANSIEPPTAEDRTAHIGFHPQKQKGRHYVGVVLPVGRIHADQLRRLADIAEAYGTGELRLTVWQNLIIPHIRGTDIAEVKRSIEAAGLGWDASSFRAGLVACTGNAGCKFAASNTKKHAMLLAEHLQSRFQLDCPINIHLTGCHHSCAQHYIGDIGLLACQVEMGEETVEGYHCAFRWRLGRPPANCKRDIRVGSVRRSAAAGRSSRRWISRTPSAERALRHVRSKKDGPGVKGVGGDA